MSRKYNFYLSSDNLNRNKIIEKTLNPRGNWNYTTEKNNVDFIFISGENAYLRDKDIYNVKCGIKNILNEQKYDIANKMNLFKNINSYPFLNGSRDINYLKQFNFDLLRQKDFSKFRKLFNNGKKWIFKPVGGWKGLYIKIFDNYDDLEKNINKIKTLWKHVWENKLIDGNGNRINFNFSKYMDLWVLQEYIDKPLLYNGYKFHIRLHFMYHQDGNGNKYSFISNKSLIRPALVKYSNKDITNIKIHDTHYVKGLGGKYYPDELKKILPHTEIVKINKQIINIFKDLTNILDAGCYPEAQRCFEIFGADLLITTSHNVVLMECNSGALLEDDNMDYFYNMVEGIFCEVIDLYYPPEKKIENNHFWFRISP